MCKTVRNFATDEQSAVEPTAIIQAYTATLSVRSRSALLRAYRTDAVSLLTEAASQLEVWRRIERGIAARQRNAFQWRMDRTATIRAGGRAITKCRRNSVISAGEDERRVVA